jgi:hypothetical protein
MDIGGLVHGINISLALCHGLGHGLGLCHGHCIGLVHGLGLSPGLVMSRSRSRS